MATEYGYRKESGVDIWGMTEQRARAYCRGYSDLTLIAREVSEPRIVSIRA